MRTLGLVTLLTLAAAGAAHARELKFPFEYVDILGPEVVGEFASRTYDVNFKPEGSSTSRFVGTVPLAGGVMAGGGFGARLVLRLDCNLRFSFDLGISAGRLVGVSGPFDEYSSVLRWEILTGIGYEWTLGERVVIHTATITGVAGQETDGAGLRMAMAGFAATAGTSPMSPVPNALSAQPPPSFSLSATDFRLGQQLGIHVQLSKMVALYADGTFDYDGQWRARAGFAIGAPRQAHN
jgi:hypothetical protein